MRAKHLTLLITPLLGTALNADASQDDNTSSRNLQCSGDPSLKYDDCATALQYAIPAGAPHMTPGGLHATHGGCNITVGSAGGNKMMKAVLSVNGQDAMKESKCYDKGSGGLKPGSAMILSMMDLASFNLTWGAAAAA